MHKKEFIVEVNFADDGDILICQLPKDLFPPIPVKKELVRCKDCKWFNTKFGECEGELNRYIHTDGSTEFTVFEPEPDFYCPFGRRKEE